MTKCNHVPGNEGTTDKRLGERPDPRLSANSLFRNVSEESIARILVCSGAKFRAYKKDETIFRQGEQADYFYALLKGNVYIISYMPSGKVNCLYPQLRPWQLSCAKKASPM